MKTHVVIDLVLYEEEGGGIVFAGTEEECHEWTKDQGFGYEVAPMEVDELKQYNQQ